MFPREWRNRQTRTFEGRVFLRTGSSPVSRTRVEIKMQILISISFYRVTYFKGMEEIA